MVIALPHIGGNANLVQRYQRMIHSSRRTLCRHFPVAPTVMVAEAGDAHRPFGSNFRLQYHVDPSCLPLSQHYGIVNT
jgi:hypothetical protein